MEIPGTRVHGTPNIKRFYETYAAIISKQYNVTVTPIFKDEKQKKEGKKPA